MYIVEPSFPWWRAPITPPGAPMPPETAYASDSNPTWLTVEQLRNMALANSNG